MTENDCPLCKPNQQPTAKLLAAISEAESGEGNSFSTMEELIKNLHVDDSDGAGSPDCSLS